MSELTKEQVEQYRGGLGAITSKRTIDLLDTIAARDQKLADLVTKLEARRDEWRASHGALGTFLRHQADWLDALIREFAGSEEVKGVKP